MMKLFDEPQLEELDLIMEGMTGPEDEKKVQQVLKGIPGVQAATIIPEGAWIRYEPKRVTKEKVAQKLAEAGFDSVTFQDSLSGQTAEVSQD
ncbi:MAG: hypothetical protein ACO1TE_18075 [Prosthecobacter sp.]